MGITTVYVDQEALDRVPHLTGIEAVRQALALMLHVGENEGTARVRPVGRPRAQTKRLVAVPVTPTLERVRELFNMTSSQAVRSALALLGETHGE